MLRIHQHDALAIALTKAIREGDVPSLERLLAENPAAASARIQDRKGGSRSPLLVTTDWPGHFPNVGAVIRLLIQHGADTNATTEGGGNDAETPLHWAASSDDVEAIDALLEGGANLEARGSIIDGGTPMNNAVAFGQFTAARRLLERGAQTEPWHAAALGLLSRVKEQFERLPFPAPQVVSELFWNACRGGQRATAQFLLERGAQINIVPPWCKETPLDMAMGESPGRPVDPEFVQWLKTLGAKTSAELK